jgi:hypothetical protein
MPRGDIENITGSPIFAHRRYHNLISLVFMVVQFSVDAGAATGVRCI